MITTGAGYIAVLALISGMIAALEGTGRFKLFKILPGIVILYFLVMLLSTFGVWTKTPDVNAAYSAVRGLILPAMIFLLLLKGDLRKIMALGPKMLLTFIAASVSIGLGFILTFLLMKSVLPEGAWQTFAALSGSWMGGTANMVAVQGALNIPETSMGYSLLMDSINYAIWVMLLLALVPLAPRFNRWTKSNTDRLDAISANLEGAQAEDGQKITTGSLALLLGLAFAASAGSTYIAGFLPVSDFFSKTTWAILIVTTMGILGALTPIGKLSGSAELGQLMLLIVVALIASRANFAELTAAPIFIIAGFVILAIHGLVIVGLAKLFRLDLFTCGIASLANIGGVASAPILAAAYSRALIPVGVLMALLGYMIGTGGGLLIGKILSGMA